MVTSDFRPEVEIWPFRACAMHNYRNSSFIVELAMGHIPRSTERIVVKFKSYLETADVSLLLLCNSLRN